MRKNFTALTNRLLIVCCVIRTCSSAEVIGSSPALLERITIDDGCIVPISFRVEGKRVFSGIMVGSYTVNIFQDENALDHLVLCDADGAVWDCFEPEPIGDQRDDEIQMERTGSELTLCLTHAELVLPLSGWDGSVYIYNDGELVGEDNSLTDRDISAEICDGTGGTTQNQQNRDTDIIVPVPCGEAPTYNPMDISHSGWVASLNEYADGNRTIVVANAHVDSREVERREERTTSQTTTAAADGE